MGNIYSKIMKCAWLLMSLIIPLALVSCIGPGNTDFNTCLNAIDRTQSLEQVNQQISECRARYTSEMPR
jgi:hypothetical protein